MTTVTIKSASGASVGTVELNEAIFSVEPNLSVLHQVVTAQLAAKRSGTQSTLTRAEVRGGGAKPWRQKGTGRARQGSTRAPHWQGGGVTHAPKPRSYKQRTPKKMERLALRSALSDRAAGEQVIVVDDLGFGETPSTKAAVALLGAIGAEGNVLMVVEHDDVVAAKSFRNLPSVHVLPVDEMNVYDVLCSDVIVFTPGSLVSLNPQPLPPKEDNAVAVTVTTAEGDADASA